MPPHHQPHLLLRVLTAAAVALVAGAGEGAAARQYNLPGLAALDHYELGVDDASKGQCTVHVNHTTLVDEFAARIRSWRQSYGDVKSWTEKTMRRHDKSASSSSSTTAVEMGRGNTVDDDEAQFGAYLKKLQELKQSQSHSPSHSTPSSGAGDVKAKMQYKITYVGYAEGDKFRAIYEKMEASAKEFGGADAFEFWDKEKVLKHHGTNSSVLAELYQSHGPNAAWAWKPREREREERGALEADPGIEVIINAALERAKPGDFVVYLDSSQFFSDGVKHSFVPLTEWLTLGLTGALGVNAAEAGGQG